MICENCGQTGIRWMGPLSMLTHTECPHCGGTNCQRAAPVHCDACEGDGVTDSAGEEACPNCDGTGRTD